ncbi:hypothetical protein LCGC14_2584360 [marine sediment metagenome]|uniref:Uncharacterized protein n=1 Tax=marine sediment metagenome TaxID=412755 RepID=A0A0F9CPL1_9ZZZZ
MSKSSGLAVLALLVGVSALGLGAYQMFFVTPTNMKSGIKNTWYSFDTDSKYAEITPYIIPVDSLLINFTVKSGESVYLHFNTMLHIESENFIFVLVLDSVDLLNSPYPTWLIKQTNSTLSVSLQLSLDTVSVGAHNVTMGITSRNTANYISSSSLLVQTYIP